VENQKFQQMLIHFLKVTQNSIMLEYHVTCKETNSKKKVVVEGKQDVISAIQSKFVIQYDIVLQQPCEDDWLDVETMDELNDGVSCCSSESPQQVLISEP